MTRLFYCCLARSRWNRFSRIDAASILRSDSGLCFNFNLSDSLLQIEHLAIGTQEYVCTAMELGHGAAQITLECNEAQGV